MRFCQHQKPETESPEPSLELRIAELEEAVGNDEGDWEPDGSEPEAGQPLKRHIFEVVDNTKLTDQAPNIDKPDESVPVFSHNDVPRPKPYLLSDSVPPASRLNPSNWNKLRPQNRQNFHPAEKLKLPKRMTFFWMWKRCAR